MESNVIQEILIGLFILSFLLCISWYFYYSRHSKSQMGVTIRDHNVTNLPEALSPPDAEKPPPSYDEATNTTPPGLRHRNSVEANMTFDEASHENKENTAPVNNSNDEKATDDASSKGNQNKSSNASEETYLTSSNINNDKSDIVQSNSNEPTESECKKDGKNNSNDDESQTKDDINSGDEGAHKSSKDDNKPSEVDVNNDVNVELDAEKFNNDNVTVDKFDEDSDKKLKTVEENKCENENICGELKKEKDVGHNVDTGVARDDVTSTAKSEGENISGSGGQDICDDGDDISISSKYHDTASIASTKYDTASCGSGATIE